MRWFSKARPEHTHALVVGIEKYEGQDADLDGPASDAVKFTHWLLERGVPVPNIHVAVTPLDKNAPLLDEWRDGGDATPTLRAATQDEIYDIVWNRLCSATGDLLILHWGGHGVVTSDKEDTRRLFFSNFPFHLDCDSLLRLLRRSDHFVDGFPDQQMCFFDACSKEVDPTALVNAFQFPTTGPNMGRRQFSLFSTAPGELARNLNEIQAGLFTNVLLEELADVWPPAVDELSDRLDARFADLKRAGKARQTPNSLWYRDPTGKRWSSNPTARGSPLRALEPIVFENRIDELAELRKALRETDTKIAWIQGLAGVGKSTLARGALDDIAGTSTSVWISCRGLSIERLVSEVAAGIGADQFGVDDADSLVQSSAAMLAQAVAPAYLVLDNFEDVLTDDDTYTDPGIGEFMRAFALYEHQVRAIVTTRRQPRGLVDDAPNHILLLKGLVLDKAAELFDSLTELDGPSTRTIVTHAAFQRLQGHPQLIRMLPAYFTLLPLDQALRELEEAPDIQEFVTSAVLDGVDDEGRLLLVAAVVFRDTFPYAALQATFEAIGGDPARVAQAMGALNRKGLIEVAGRPGTYFLHPIIRDRVPRGDQTEASAHAAAADHDLAEPIVGEDPDTWDSGLFHLRRAAQLSGSRADFERFRDFVEQHHSTLQWAGFGRRVVAERRHLEALTDDPAEALIGAFGLACILWKQGDLDEAGARFQHLDERIDELLAQSVGEVVVEFRQALSSLSVRVGAKLGDILQRNGDAEAARKYADKIDAIVLDPPDPLDDYRRAELRFAIARRERDYAAALPWAEKLLVIAEQAASGEEGDAGWLDRAAEGHFSVGVVKMMQGEDFVHHLVRQLAIKAQLDNVPGMAAAAYTLGALLSPKEAPDKSNADANWPAALVITAAQINREADIAGNDDVAERAELLAPRLADNPAAIAKAEEELRGWSPKLVPYYHRALETFLGISPPGSDEGDPGPD